MANFEKSKYEEIKSYLNKTMPSDKRQKFEEEMATNKDLANEVRAQEFDRSFEFLSIKADVKEMFTRLKDEEDKKATVPTPSMWIVFVRKPYFRALAAAIVLILAGIGIWQYIDTDNNGITEGPDTSKSHRETPNRVIEARLALDRKISEKINEFARLSKQSNRQDVPKELTKAISAYDQVDIEDTSAIRKTARLFERPKITNKPNDSTIFGASQNNKSDLKTESFRSLYQGLIFLYSGEYNNAIRKFNNVTGELQDEARFYKALAYLKNNDTEQGRELLNKIIKNSKSESLRTQAQDLSALLDQKK